MTAVMKKNREYRNQLMLSNPSPRFPSVQMRETCMSITQQTSRRRANLSSLRLLFALSVGLAVFGLTGCISVGPDYKPPQEQSPATWQTPLGDGLTSGTLDPKALTTWWTVLNDPVLTNLIECSVRNNFDVKQALARVREARARRGAAVANLFPTLDLTGSITKSHTRTQAATVKGSGAGASAQPSGGGGRISSDTDLYKAGFDASWEIDVFGGSRRSVEAAKGDLQAAQAKLHDALVSLCAEVALNYVDLRTYQLRLALAESGLAIQRETLELVEWRLRAGLTNELAVQQARYNVESTASQIPTLR